jgi:polar amino acid transport system substrate-binding protein
VKKSFLPFSLIVSILTILLFSQCEKETTETYRYPLQFITEDYKPFNYLENSALKGLAPDMLKEICEQLNIPFQVSILPWDEAYTLAQQTDNAVLFSTDMNSVRKDLFKWAGPIVSSDWLFYALPKSLITLNTLDDAKKVERIGVLSDYSIEQYLTEKGFTNLVVCSDITDAFDKLLKEEIDLVPSDRFTAEAALNNLDKTIYSVSEKMVIKTEMTYVAFNKNVPDDVVADFQLEIDRLKGNGVMKTLYQTYFNSPDFPGTLQIYTEQYPPLSYINNIGEISGFGADIVGEIMKRNTIFAKIRLSNWENGYNLALNNPNFCLFTMDRTELRENLFQWIGPIGTNTTWIYTKAGSGVTISSVEDARHLQKVGTVSSWFSDQYLREQGFTNLVSDDDPAVMAEKLLNNEIDAFVCSSVTFPYILKELDYQYSEVIPSVSLMSSDYYIAFSTNTPISTISLWQTTLDAMKLDGTYDAIFQKWLQ